MRTPHCSPGAGVLARLLACLLLLGWAAPLAAAPVPSTAPVDPQWRPLVDKLAADGLDKAFLDRLFAPGSVPYQPQLMARKVDAMLRKEFEPRPKPGPANLRKSSYRFLLTPASVSQAVRFVRDNQAAFDQARRDYGPPPQLVAAFLMVETRLGSYLGDRDALSVLASLARSSDLEDIAPFMKRLGQSPERRRYAAWAAGDRAAWAYRELVALLRYAAAKKQHPGAIPGSIYGAIGICQFMPTNALRFGVDGDQNGVVDLFCPHDAIVSVASYLHGHGWKPGMTAQERHAVVYAYNHSDLYVLAVLTLSDRIGKGLRAAPGR